MERKCANCALRNLQNGVCPIFHGDMSDENGCPHYVSHLEYCEICGDIIIKGGTYEYEPEDKEWHLMCDKCSNGHPCAGCINVNQCAFQTDQSCPEPPYVMVQQQQGNMFIQTQQPNPKRIDLTCAKGCPCYYEAGRAEGMYCIKQLECGCGNMKMNWRK